MLAWSSLAFAVLVIGAPVSRTFVLDNGLRVRLEPIEGPRTVAVAVGFRAGSRDDPPDRPGLAHLTEHLSVEVSGLSHGLDTFGLVEAVGGITNATTDEEATLYYAETPSRWLESLLWLQLARMSAPSRGVTDARVEAERRVVQREIEPRADDMRLIRHRVERAYAFGPDHPLTPADLDTVEETGRHTAEDVRWFLDTYYRPDLASLVVLGGFDPDAAERFIRARFEAIPRPAEPPYRRPRPPPPTAKRRRFELHRALYWDEARLLWVRDQPLPWAISRMVSVMIDARVDRGEIRRRRQVLLTDLERRSDGAYFELTLRPAAGESIDALTADTRAKVEDALSRPFAEEEMVDARRRLRYFTIRSTSYVWSARQAARAMLFDEPASTVERLSALRSVTLEQIEQARRQLRESRRVESIARNSPGKFETDVVEVEP